MDYEKTLYYHLLHFLHKMENHLLCRIHILTYLLNLIPNLVLKLPIILEHLFLSATINNTLPSTKLNLSLSNCLTLSSKNLSKEDLNPPSTTLIYPNTLCNP